MLLISALKLNQKNMPQNSIPEATEYVVVQPKTTLAETVTPAAIASLRREVIFQAQGEAVELFDGMPSLTTALSFAAAYDVADEIVFRIDSDRLILIFDHQPKENLRPEEVDETIWKEILKLKEKIVIAQDTLAPTPELTVDLAVIWERAGENNDIIARTKIFIELFVKELKPAVAVHLRGEIPNLPLLAAIYLARPCGHTVIFEDAAGNSIILFSNI